MRLLDLAVVLRQRPNLLEQLPARLAAKLVGWHCRSSRSSPFDGDLVDDFANAEDVPGIALGPPPHGFVRY